MKELMVSVFWLLLISSLLSSCFAHIPFKKNRTAKNFRSEDHLKLAKGFGRYRYENNDSFTITLNISKEASIPLLESQLRVLATHGLTRAEAFMSVWSPKSTSAFRSRSLIRLMDYPHNVIEAGFQVAPGYFNGDGQPRIYASNSPIYTCSRDCPGFVKYSTRGINLGSAILPTSVYDKSDRTIKVALQQISKGWELQFTGSQGMVKIGYWPSSLFGNAYMAHFGGEVSAVGNPKRPPPHPIQMGSGHYASEGLLKAAVFRNVSVHGVVHTDKNPDPDDNGCYSYREAQRNTNWGRAFFYGGPGCKQ